MFTFNFKTPFLLFALAFIGISMSSCNKDSEDQPTPQTVEDVRDLAVGTYAYTMVWHDISSGIAIEVDDIDPITGTVELRKSDINSRTIDLYEDGELFQSFDDLFESESGFSFNDGWVFLPYEGETYSFFAYDSFVLDGEEVAGAYYHATQELNFAFFVEIGNRDLTLTFHGEKMN
jgi:hypothetical protein